MDVANDLTYTPLLTITTFSPSKSSSDGGVPGELSKQSLPNLSRTVSVLNARHIHETQVQVLLDKGMAHLGLNSSSRSLTTVWTIGSNQVAFAAKIWFSALL